MILHYKTLCLDPCQIQTMDAPPQPSTLKMISRFPNRIPIFVDKEATCKKLGVIDKNKFLAPQELSFGEFSYVIRKRLKAPPEVAIFFFINHSIMAQTSATMRSLYDEHVSSDLMLHVSYGGENTFGSF